MGKKSKPPPGPDWDRLIDLSTKYAAENARLQNEYMDFFKGQYADQKALNDQIAAIQLPAMQEEAAFAKQQRDRYQNMGIPFEDKYLDKITNWDNAARRDERAGEAQAGIASAAQAARESEIRRLEGYGIDPSQTRSAALDSGLRLQEAIAKAGAGNAERKAVETEGLALGGEAVNIYRGLPAQTAASMATATNSGQAAYGNQQALGGAGAAGYAQGANMNAQGFNMQNAAYGTANSIYGNNLTRHEINQQASGGLGKLAGATLGAAGAAGGFGTLLGFGAEGGPVGYAAEGGAIPTGNTDRPPAAQPRPVSQGIPSDKKPMMLTPGEFVIPDDVARWEGEKNLQKIINKSREERTQTEAERSQNQRALGIPA